MLTIASNCTSSQPPRNWLCCKKSLLSHPPTAKSVDVCTPHTPTQHHHCSLTLRFSAIVALCHHSSLPSRLSTLPSISLTLLPMEHHENVEECLSSACPSPPRALTGMHLQAPIKMPPPQPFFPIPGSMSFHTIYLTRDNTAQRVCSSGAGFNPPEFLLLCGLPVS